MRSATRWLEAAMLAVLAMGTMHAQDELRGVVIVMRHGVRAPIASETRDGRYNAEPWPQWPVAPGVLTPHGTQALTLLGRFYAARYAALLHDCAGVYAMGNNTQRTVASAKAFVAGLAPQCAVAVEGKAEGPRNPLFNMDEEALPKGTLLDAMDGRVSGRADWFARSYADGLAELEEALCGTACAAGVRRVDSIVPAAGAQFDLADTAPAAGADFAENFVLEYAEGMPMQQVGWGRVDRARLERLLAMNTRFHDFVLRTPLYAQVAGSDLLERIGRTLRAMDEGSAVDGQIGPAGERVVLLAGHDSNLTWLGGLLRLEWLLPDEPQNATPPGSALVFEEYRDRASGATTVRVRFVSATLEQTRGLTALHADGPVAGRPSVAPVYVPGCSGAEPEYACSLAGFGDVVRGAVETRFLEPALRGR